MKTFIMCLLFCVTAGMYAQKGKHEQIKALKVSFFTTELNLSADEAAKFWPVYNTYDDKVFRLRHDVMRPIIKKMDATGIDKISAKEAEMYLNKLEDADRDLFNRKQKLVEDLKPIIGPVKILKLKKAEEDFKRRLLEQYRDKRKE